MTDTLPQASCHHDIQLTPIEMRLLNSLARQALITPHADVLLTIGKSKVYARPPKPTPKVMTWIGVKALVPQQRLYRPEFEHLAPKEVIPTLEEAEARYKETYRQCCADYRAAKAAGKKIRIESWFFTPEEYLRKGLLQKKLGKFEVFEKSPSHPYMKNKALQGFT